MAVLVRRKFFGGIWVATLISALAVAGCGGGSHTTRSHSGATGLSASATASPTTPGAGQTSSSAHKKATRSHNSAGAAHGQAGSKSAAGSGQPPSGAVATVAGQAISRAAYQTAYRAEFASLTSSGIPLDPPSYRRCVAGYAQTMRKLQARLPKKARAHIPRSSHAQLLRDCQDRYRSIKLGVMTQLIQARWTLAAAKADHIGISTAQVNRTLAAQEKAMGGPKAWSKYLKRSGQTRAKLMATTRLGLIEEALQKRRLGAPAHVSEQQVAAFFKAHHAEFVLPHQKRPKLSTYATRIRLVLQEQVQSRRAAAANLAYERHWRALTRCAPGYVVSLCANWRS